MIYRFKVGDTVRLKANITEAMFSSIRAGGCIKLIGKIATIKSRTTAQDGWDGSPPAYEHEPAYKVSIPGESYNWAFPECFLEYVPAWELSKADKEYRYSIGQKVRIKPTADLSKIGLSSYAKFLPGKEGVITGLRKIQWDLPSPVPAYAVKITGMGTPNYPESYLEPVIEDLLDTLFTEEVMEDKIG